MKTIHVKVHVSGIVQGVGFRPFIHKQIDVHTLTGTVRNTASGAELELEGEEAHVHKFIEELWTKKPRLAIIESVETELQKDLAGFTDFRIIQSLADEEKNTLVSPDVCICEDCLREMRDPNNRRYRYPFLNCTNCGPRFTIVKEVPYDRARTTMAPFPMCEPCAGEYGDIEDRRYHAQPTCCTDCGPQLL